MGYLPVVVGIEDSTGARADAKRADGNRSAIILRFSNMFTASSEADGGITRVFIGSSIAAIDGAGVLTIGASATSIIIGGAGIPVSVPGDFSVGGDVTIDGDLTVEGTTTSIHSTVLDVSDRVIHVNHSDGDDDPVPTDIAGIAVHRGAIAGVDRDHAGWIWDEANSMWRAALNTGGDDATIGADLAVRTGTLSVTTGGDVSALGLVRLPDAASITAWGTGPATIDMLTKDAADTVYVGGAQVGARPNALDYSSTTGHWFRTGVTSKLIIEPGYVRLGVELRWDNTVASPAFYQADLANGTGQTMLWHAQDAIIGIGGDLDIRPGAGPSHGALALQDGGGADRVIVDGGGEVAVDGASNILMKVATSTIGQWLPAGLRMNKSLLEFGKTISAPVVSQDPQDIGNGQLFTVASQDADEDAAVTAGAILCKGGDASDGGAFANVGGAATLQGGDAAGSGASVGGDAVVQAGDGVTDGSVRLRDGAGNDRVLVSASGSVTLISSSSIEARIGAATQLEIGANFMRFHKNVVAPQFYQDTHATTPQTMLFHSMDVTTGTGSDLNIRPGSGSVAHGALALQDGGDTARITVDAAGVVSTDSTGSSTFNAATLVSLNTAGSNRLIVRTTSIQFRPALVQFLSSTSLPIINQETLANGNGQLFTVAAQDADEADAVTAGALLLEGGFASDGTAVDNIGGSATLKGGAANGSGASVGGDAIVKPGAGVTDGQVLIKDGGNVSRITVTADGNVVIGSTVFAFADTVSAPFMGHFPAATGNGELLTITAQDAEEAAAVTGGSFLLRAGPASNNGAFANVGGSATLQGGDANGSGARVGGDVILQPGDGVTDGKVLIKDGGGTPRLTIDATELIASVPVGVPIYDVAGAPAAAGMDGRIIYVTDGDAGSACLACGDGTNWKVISLGATIST